MGLRFRQSIKVLPGVRINLGLHGISATIGPRGANVNFGPRGTHLNLGLPGTGISLRLRLDKLSFDPGRADTPDDPSVRAEIIQYKSVDVSALGSESIARVSDLLKKLHRQRHVVSLAIAQAEDDFSRTQRCTKRLLWLRRRLAPQAVAQRQDYEQACEERLALLKEIKKTLILDVDFAISNEAKAVFKNIVSAFDRIRSCTRIWDITSAQTIDRYRTRKAATHELNMLPVSFTRTHDFLLATEFQPPRFTNANGADLLLYPAFVVAQGVDGFALLDIREVQIIVVPTRFVINDGDVPSDARIIDQTWRYVNKDGSPDRRFSSNPGIPVAEYYQIFFRGNGLNEGWMVSNAEAGIAFREAIQEYKESLIYSTRELKGLAPPSADEWPDLDLPDRPDPPPIEWKAPFVCYSFFAAAVLCVFLAIQNLNPQLLSSIIDLRDALQSKENSVVHSKRNDSNLPIARLEAVTETAVPLTATDIAEMQKLLKRLGFNPGSIDGKAGTRTQKALSDWAKSHGVNEPKLNRATLEHLKTANNNKPP